MIPCIIRILNADVASSTSHIGIITKAAIQSAINNINKKLVIPKIPKTIPIIKPIIVNLADHTKSKPHAAIDATSHPTYKEIK